MTKITLWSDLHFEINGFSPVLNKVEPGEVLILAGDIICARFYQDHRVDNDSRKQKKYLKKLCEEIFPNFECVVYITGNHEPYGYGTHNMKKTIQEAFDKYNTGKYNFHYLDDTSITYKDLNIFGCTLWTDYNKGNPNDLLNAEFGMNDYRLITINDYGVPLRPEICCNWHQQSLGIMKEWIDRSRKNTNLLKKIVVTHHGPTYKSLNTDHSGNGLDSSFVSDLSDFILYHPDIKLWCHGHTHKSLDYMVGDYTRVIANQMGYNSEQQYKKFDPNKSWEI